jgi:hypothetical protein
MQGLFGLLLAAMTASVGYLIAFERGRSRLRAWREAAAAVGLTGVSEASSFGIPTGVEGKADPLVVRLGSYRRGKTERGTRIEIGGLGHGGLVDVRAEGVGSRLAKVFGDREIALGDADFDDVAYVQGTAAMARAVLGADARRGLRALLAGSFSEAPGLKELTVRTTLLDGHLRVEIRDRVFEDVQSRLPAIARQLLAVGRLLVRPDDVALRIAENTRCESLASVRLVNLETLATEYPQHAATRPTLVAALDDPSPEVQLHAAIGVGPDGRETLLRLARRDDVPEKVVVRAIAALGVHFPEDLAAEALRHTRESGRLQIARACIDRLAVSGAATYVQDLASLLSSTTLDLAAAAAGALGSVASDTSENALVGALGSPEGEVRLVAVASLGRMGSALAVAPLHTCGAGHPFDPPLRSAIRQAVAAIQSRIAGASPGQLTLATDDVGQVSLADTDAAGQVSLASERETSAAAPEIYEAAGTAPDAVAGQPDAGRRLQEHARRAQLEPDGSTRR